MNYYITIPRPSIKLEINPIYANNDEELQPYISPSTLYYLNDVKNQIKKIKSEINRIYNTDYIFNLINPYDFIFSEYDNTNKTVSLLPMKTMLYYNMLEINLILNIMNNFYNSSINVLLYTLDNSAIKYYIQSIKRENNSFFDLSDETLSGFQNYDLINKECHNTGVMSLMIFELNESICNNIDNYINYLLYIVLAIIYEQTNDGLTILKITQLCHKPIIDIIYLLSSFFNKTYICKPYISYQEERFIIYEKYINNYTIEEKNKIIYNIKKLLLRETSVISILKNTIPLYVLNKIEDSNIIIGYHSLEHYNELINICKSKNISERIDTFKKNSINKSIQWCCSHNIPCNK